MNNPSLSPAALAALPDEKLLEAVQRQTFAFFWEASHPVSGLAPDRCTTSADPADDLVATGGSGFSVMAHIVAAERGWITRAAAAERIGHMLELLNRATCYHGVYPHFMNGRTGATIPFSRKDDGGDLVETSFLFMGLLCAREYFKRKNPQESKIRGLIDYLWSEVEWTWYTRGGSVLQWHWSPNNGWALDHDIRGWNECLVTYVLAASAPRYRISPRVYHEGFAVGRNFLNGKSYYDFDLPLGAPFGGPLFLSQYSFCAMDPRNLTDRYADYWQQNVNHVHINRAHCVKTRSITADTAPPAGVSHRATARMVMPRTPPLRMTARFRPPPPYPACPTHRRKPSARCATSSKCMAKKFGAALASSTHSAKPGIGTPIRTWPSIRDRSWS